MLRRTPPWLCTACRAGAALLFLALAAGCVPQGESEPKALPTDADRALLQQLEDAIAAAQGTPAQEAANFANPKDWAWKLVQALRSDEPVPAGRLKRARDMANHLLTNCRKGPDWPAPATFDVPRAAAPPTIDGKLTDAAWERALVLTGVYPFGSTERRDEPETTWRLSWDADHLYLAFECQDTNLLAPELKRDAPVFAHDCVELFLLPRFETGVYWELVIGPGGSIYDALHVKYRDRWGRYGRPELDIEGLQVATRVRGTPNDPSDTDEGYTVEVALPRAALPEYAHAPLAAGQTLHAMLVRLDKDNDSHDAYAFQPLLSWGHNIWCHVALRLAD